MKTARVSVCLAILFGAASSSPLFAQGPPGVAPVGGSGAPDTYDRFDHRNVMLRSDIGDGVGYSKGYQTFALFQPIIIEPDELMLFLSPRGIVTYLGDVAANAGAGFRWYDDSNDRIFGGSFWYDTDNTGQFKYDQLGISLESLGQYLDFRVNGYMPTNDDRDLAGQFLNGQINFFQNFIGFGRSTRYSTPLKGGDFEVGGLLPGIGNRGIRPYIGGYYYQGEGTGAVYGVRARIEALITQDIWAQVLVTDDRLFGTNLMGAVTMYFGSGQAARWFERLPVQDRLYQQVERQYRIAVYEEVYNDTLTALRAGGTGGSGGPVGTPIFVTHVDNSAPGGGDGTVEHPLNTLPTTTGSNVDIVFVNRGNGTSSGYNHGITLNDWQRLLGQGIHHDFTSTVGTFELPGFSPGTLPILTNPTGDVIKLASHNEVSGFQIQNAGRHGIFGSGIVDFNINNVLITGSGQSDSAGGGIILANATGTGRVFESIFNDSAAEGLRIDNNGGDLQLRVDDVEAKRNLTGISINGENGANFNVIVRNADTSDSDRNGIDVALTSGSSIVGLFDNITSNGNNRPQDEVGFGYGFRMTLDASFADVTLQHSTFDENNIDGVSALAQNLSIMNLNLFDNSSTINNNLRDGVRVISNNSNSSVTLRNNVINNNSGFGVNVIGTDGTLNLIADNNRILRNRGAGIAYTLRDSASGTIDIQRNLITNTGNDLVGSTIYNGQAIDIRLDGSTDLSDATAHLTSGIIDHNTIGNLDSDLFANDGGGIIVHVDQRTRLENLTIGNSSPIAGDGNIIARNDGDGIHIIRRDEGIVNNVLIGANRIENNTGDGIQIDGHNSPNDVNDYTIQHNRITDNGSDGINLFVEADSQIQVDIFDNLIDGNHSDGIETRELANSASDLRTVTGTWQRNVITNNGFQGTIRVGHGIQLNGATDNLLIGSTSNSANGNLIAANGLKGIEINGDGDVTIGFNEIARNGTGGIDLQGASTNIVDITRNYIHNNNGDGIEILSQGPFATIVDITLNTIRDNRGRGIDILNRATPGLPDNGGFAIINIDNNLIVGNRQIGVYVVNSASTTQDQNQAASAVTNTSDNNGSVFADPRLFFTFTNNRVEGNGFDSDFGTTGLVLRVGTSGGGYGPFDDGGFFGEGRSGVGATITDNVFSGNLGDDVYFDSFNSTVDPTATAGTWDAATFTITSFQGDPLARLDLTFNDNIVDSFGVTNTGAAYTNAEGTFKSRTTAATDPGPFLSDSRQRNAQRLAGRFGLPPVTPGGASNLFRYSGIGQSTFRLLAAPSGNADAGGPVNPFFFDTDFLYVSPFFSANGIFAVGPGPIESMPYGWNQLGGATPRPQ